MERYGDVSTRVNKLSPAARRLLEIRMRGGGAGARIPRRAETDAPVLSCAQERFWFLQQWDRHGAMYNRAAAFRVTGRLDYDILRRSVDLIVSRHDALRARLIVRHGVPELTIAPPAPAPFQVTLLDGNDSVLLDAIRADALRPYDLAAGCLLRTTVFRMGPDDHALLIGTHHIATDRWSDSVLFAELEQLYAAGGDAAAAALPDLPIQYSDFAAWQRTRLNSGALARELEYWTNQLAGAPQLLTLPIDKPRPAEQQFDGAAHTFTIDKATLERLRALGRSENTTLFGTLLAAFGIVLRRWSEQTDLVIGAPIAGRTRVETEGLIGCFTNTLPLRLDLSGELTFGDLLKRVRSTTLDAFANAELPFERASEAATIERTSAYSPLVQVMFALQNAPRRALALAGTQVSPVPLHLGTAKLDLTLEATETEEGLACALEYSTALFAGATILRLAERFKTTIAVVVESPSVPIHRLPLLNAGEKARLRLWNETAMPRGTAVIHTRVEEQAGRRPSAIAVVANGHRLSYAELDGRANQFAHALARQGAGPGTLVGVSIERGTDLIVTLLAVLKSGAAYVPLDREYPDARLAAILADSQPRLVVSDRPLAQQGGRTLLLDELRALASSLPASPPHVTVSGSDLAYVLFTSGSTGRPKGVMMTHAPVCNHVDWMQSAHPILPSDRRLHHTSIAFDVAVGEIFGTLAAGATLVVADAGGHRDPAYLARLIAAERVTVIDVIPRMLQALLDEPAFENGGRLRQVHCGAEVMPPELVQRFLAHSNARLLNLYGPTETCIDVAAWRCVRDATHGTVPIGRPIGNVRIHILDRDMQLVPPGQPGELYVGGAALAQGYLNQPALTARAFVANPIDPHHSPLLYRTGDIGRHRADGAIEFLGRRDRQVRIRGMRIELGDVEAAICGIDGVTDCVAMIRPAATGDPRLVAFVETTIADGDAATIHDALVRTLPSNMVPDEVVPLERLPRGPAGKIDTATLLRRESTAGASAPSDLPPSTDQQP